MHVSGRFDDLLQKSRAKRKKSSPMHGCLFRVVLFVCLLHWTKDLKVLFVGLVSLETFKWFQMTSDVRLIMAAALEYHQRPGQTTSSTIFSRFVGESVSELYIPKFHKKPDGKTQVFGCFWLPKNQVEDFWGFRSIVPSFSVDVSCEARAGTWLHPRAFCCCPENRLVTGAEGLRDKQTALLVA